MSVKTKYANLQTLTALVDRIKSDYITSDVLQESAKAVVEEIYPIVQADYRVTLATAYLAGFNAHEVEIARTWEFDADGKTHSGASMFKDDKELYHFPYLDMSGIALSAQRMFEGCTNLLTIGFPDFSLPDILWIDNIFSNCTSLQEIGNVNAHCMSASNMFNGCVSLKKIGNLNLGNAASIDGMFAGCRELEEVPEGFSISHLVSSLDSLFEGCSKIEFFTCFNEDWRKIDTSNVKFFNRTFAGCSSLETAWVVIHSATEMSEMFKGCTKLDSLYLEGLGFCMNNIDLTGIPNWGANDRESLWQTFADLPVIGGRDMDNDGAPAEPCIISLDESVKERLEDWLMADIIDKGWTIA